MKITPLFTYAFSKELPFKDLEKFSHHRRLKVFVFKGTKCLSCPRVGIRLIEGKERKGNRHLGIYAEEGNGTLIPMSVDHIVPKSRGGSNDLSNLQPLCLPCNQLKADSLKIPEYQTTPRSFVSLVSCKVYKGSKFILLKNVPELNQKSLTEQNVYRLSPNRQRFKVTFEGTLLKISTNPHTGKPAALVRRERNGKTRVSYLNINSLLIRKPLKVLL